MNQLVDQHFLFFKEARILFKEWHDALLCLASSCKPKNELDKMLCILHTLKGNSSMARFENLTDLIHNLEESLINMKMGDEELFIDHVALRTHFNKLKICFEVLQKDLIGPETIENPHELRNLHEFANRCQEVVKFVASELHKDVHFTFEGENLQLTNEFISALNEATSHILRNAVDHGVSQKGRVHITAFMTHNKFILKIKDNGKGMNSKVIFKKAHQKGVIPHKAKIANYTEDQIYHFLFLPGFSTAENIDHISGRGIGLDASKTKINSLNGDIEIKTSPQGTIFSIIIPVPSKNNVSVA